MEEKLVEGRNGRKSWKFLNQHIKGGHALLYGYEILKFPKLVYKYLNTSMLAYQTYTK